MVYIMSQVELSTPHKFHLDSGKDVFIDNKYGNSEYIAQMSQKLAEMAFNARLESLRYILLNVPSVSDSFDIY
jgi:hypothetical protein